MVDPTGRADGRGAYLHNIRSCWEQAIKGTINNALKVELTAKDILKLTEFMSTLPDAESSQGSRTNELDQKGTAS